MSATPRIVEPNSSFDAERRFARAPSIHAPWHVLEDVSGGPQDLSTDTDPDDRHHEIVRERPHEQVQDAGLHRVRLVNANARKPLRHPASVVLVWTSCLG